MNNKQTENGPPHYSEPMDTANPNLPPQAVGYSIENVAAPNEIDDDQAVPPRAADNHYDQTPQASEQAAQLQPPPGQSQHHQQQQQQQQQPQQTSQQQPAVKMDFSKLDDKVLRKYRRVLRLKTNKPIQTRRELISAVSKHFSAQEVTEKETITHFIYALRNQGVLWKASPHLPPDRS